jgi:hypothetical protein
MSGNTQDKCHLSHETYIANQMLFLKNMLLLIDVWLQIC